MCTAPPNYPKQVGYKWDIKDYTYAGSERTRKLLKEVAQMSIALTQPPLLSPSSLL